MQPIPNSPTTIQETISDEMIVIPAIVQKELEEVVEAPATQTEEQKEKAEALYEQFSQDISVKIKMNEVTVNGQVLNKPAQEAVEEKALIIDIDKEKEGIEEAINELTPNPLMKITGEGESARFEAIRSSDEDSTSSTVVDDEDSSSDLSKNPEEMRITSISKEDFEKGLDCEPEDTSSMNDID